MRQELRWFLDRNGGDEIANGVALLLERWMCNARKVAEWREAQKAELGPNWFDGEAIAAAEEEAAHDARSAPVCCPTCGVPRTAQSQSPQGR